MEPDIQQFGQASYIARVACGECLGTRKSLDEETPLSRDAIATAGRMPWPSVDGNPPVDRQRPFLDLRRLNRD